MERLREVGDVSLPATGLGRRLSNEELRHHVKGSAALISMLYDRVDATVLDAGGDDLRIVANVAVGFDNIDVTHATNAGIQVTNTPSVLAAATADFTLGLILDLTRRISEGDRLIRRGGQWRWEFDFMLGAGLQGATLGIVGAGEIGRLVALRAQAFGMRVVVTTRRRPDSPGALPAGTTYLELDELFRQSDVVSLHCPLNTSTWHLVDERRLRLMKPSAVLVNTSRGPVVDERALAAALERRQIAGAALDVFEHEPSVDDRLLGLDNTVLAPHLGSATSQTRTAMADLAAANVVSVLGGGPALTPVPLT
jgi:lactate dehydrogenase-like 2-hydroxyacid dehydrogenase